MSAYPSTNPSPIQIVEDNVIAYYKGISRSLGGRFYEQAHIVWFITGRRSLMRFNGVLMARTSPGTLAALLDPILAHYLSNRLPFFWADFPPGSIPGLGQYLISHGIPLTAKEVPAMQCGLSDLPAMRLPDQVEIVEVKTEQDQADWLDVHMQGFNEPEEARVDFRQLLDHSLAESNSTRRYFLARCQGEPCAISSLLHAPLAAGVYHVTTLPAYRGRGLGKALTLVAMQAARASGYTGAVLFATPDGYPLYQKLGFVTVVTADLYAWTGNPST